MKKLKIITLISLVLIFMFVPTVVENSPPEQFQNKYEYLFPDAEDINDK